MRVLITGASGFIGTHLVKRLSETEQELLWLDLRHTKLDSIDQIADSRRGDVLSAIAKVFPLGLLVANLATILPVALLGYPERLTAAIPQAVLFPILIVVQTNALSSELRVERCSDVANLNPTLNSAADADRAGLPRDAHPRCPMPPAIWYTLLVDGYCWVDVHLGEDMPAIGIGIADEYDELGLRKTRLRMIPDRSRALGFDRAVRPTVWENNERPIHVHESSGFRIDPARLPRGSDGRAAQYMVAPSGRRGD